MGCDAPGVCDQLGVGCKFACDIRSRASAAYIGYGADLRETLSPSQACRVSFGATTPRRRRASTVPAPCKHSAGHDLGSACIVLAPDGSDQSRIGCAWRGTPTTSKLRALLSMAVCAKLRARHLPNFSADGGKVTTCSKLRTSRRPAVP